MASAGLLRLRDLGTLVVEVDGIVRMTPGTRPARLLSMLLVHVNRRVPVDALLSAVWGEQAGQSAVGTMESHVWRLRKAMEPGRPARQPATYLVNDTNGYRLVVDPDNVDSLRFAQLTDQGDDALISGAADRALRLYDQALQLWRGRPFEAVVDEDWAAPAVARLDEMHAHVEEQRIEALLRLGDHEGVIGLLEELTAAMPFRERLWAQLMLARYRAGRIEEALRTYQRARTVLRDELGLEPGDELRTLHTRILEQDPSLAPPPAAPTGPAAAARPGEVHLPVRLSTLIGRDTERGRLRDLVRRYRLVSLVGAAGCGKTRLAIEVARSAAEWALDGVWFVDLTAVEDPDAVPEAVAGAMGIAARPVGDATSMVRSYLQDRQVLLVLDNCEHVLAAVGRLLDEILGENPLHVLATSREPLDLDGEVLWTLAPLAVHHPEQQDTGPSAAAQLFLDRAENADPTFTATTAALDDIEALCAAVDGIPLAIELAAGRVRSASLPEIRRQVDRGLGGLARAGIGRTDHHQTVDRSIEWSIRLLSSPEAVVHERLSVLPGVFTVAAAAAVVGVDPVRTEEVPELLSGLVHRSLLAVVPGARPDVPTRFRQLATVRAHAARALAARGDTEVVLLRRTEWLRDLLADRPPVDAGDPGGWYARVEHNHDTLSAVLQHVLVDRPEPVGVHATARLTMYWYYRNRMLDGERWMRAALAQHDADAADRMRTQLGLAYSLALRDRADLAAPLIRDVLADPHALPKRTLVDGLAGAAWSAWVRRDPALDFVRDELGLLAADGDPAAVFSCDLLDATHALRTEGPARTAVRAADLFERATARQDLVGAWLAGLLAVACALAMGDAPTGRRLLDRVERHHRELGGTFTANLLELRADFAVLEGDDERAARLFARSRALAFRAGTPWPIAAASPPLIAQVRRRLPAEEYEKAWRNGQDTARSLGGDAPDGSVAMRAG